MVETQIINWDDVKNIQIESFDNMSTTHNVVKNTSMNKDAFADNSVWVNRNTCEKVTAMYAREHKTTLCYDKTKPITHWFGNGSTVCVKARRDVYNKYGNFTFTDADLDADLVAIYSYDGVTKKGTWHICDMRYVRPITIRDPKGFLKCPEKPIISHATSSIEVNFRKN